MINAAVVKILLLLLLLTMSAFSLTLIGDVRLQQARGLSASDGDTITVELPAGRQDRVRYAGINAPGLDQCLGEEAKERNEQLIKGQTLWLELDPADTDSGYRRDNHGRLLAHVFLAPGVTQTGSVELQLVNRGYARLDVINPRDRAIEQGDDFVVRYADWIIAAQIAAARAHLGWWQECDEHASSNMIIAAIRQWGADEIVYIVNRGAVPIDLSASWLLHDGGRKHVLKFEERFPEGCELPGGALLKIHSGPFATDRRNEPPNCNQGIIDLYWTGRKIWGNDGDEAWLYRPDGSVAYRYYYPLNWD